MNVRLRGMVLLSFAAVLGGWPVGARADAYACGGRTSRVDVGLVKSGNNSGAGEGGWSLDTARRFARWLNAIEEILPRGTALLVRVEPGGASRLQLRRGVVSVWTRNLDDGVLGACDSLEPIATLLARHLGVAPPAPSAGKPNSSLFTIELGTAMDSSTAHSFANKLNDEGVALPGVLFYEKCLPCGSHDVTVVDDAKLGPRVVIGLFRSKGEARHALAELRRRWNLKGTVRQL